MEDLQLSPMYFLEKASISYRDQISIVYETVKYTWRETYERCLKLASSLCHLGISRGDIVAAVAPNVPALYELHFCVPMAGAILAPLNPTLDATTLAILLKQLEAKVIFVDYQFIDLVHKSLENLSGHVIFNAPVIILIPAFDEEFNFQFTKMPSCSYRDYNNILSTGDVTFEFLKPKSEFDPISICYTSGTTGTPKGVMYSYRGVYLNALAQIFRNNMSQNSVILWTVDMFRCNGWCLPWAMAALGGTNICIRQLSGKNIIDSILSHNVTHLCGAPVLLTMIADFDDSIVPFSRKVEIMVAGVLPKIETMSKVENLGFHITHAYGMTEALGPVITKLWKINDKICETSLPLPRCHLIEVADVKDMSTLKSVPYDGETIGEVMFKGNNLMMGYFKNPKATQDAFVGGWFRTGDIGVRHKDGHIEMKDRTKDVIMFGTTVISTLQIEAALVSHPLISEAAVVGKFDAHLGKNVPWAFVNLKLGRSTSVEEIIECCKGKLESHMVPHRVIFGVLPVNSTGKVQKFLLREKIKEIEAMPYS